MKRFTQLPFTLYRIQPGLPVNLRSHDMQMAIGRKSFDLKLYDGLVQPIHPNDHFHTPNGMSLRPWGSRMDFILKSFPLNRVTIFTIDSGLKLPPHFVIYHEHSDHYSLQTNEPVSLRKFNERLTSFLKSLPFQTVEEFYKSVRTKKR